MVEQNPYTVILRVEKARLDSFEQGLDQSISRKKVNVATRTEAQLFGEDFSIILEEASARKVVGEDTYQEWRWQITPKSSGPHRAGIVVSPIAQLKDVMGGRDEGETPYGDPYRDFLDISVAKNWAAFFREQFPHWSNIAIGTGLGLLISLVGWLIRRIKERNNPTRSGPTNAVR
jgi:hypothetical protein